RALCREVLRKFLERVAELLRLLVGHRPGLFDPLEDIPVRAAYIFMKHRLVILDVFDRERVEKALVRCENRNDLQLHRHWLILRLLQDLHKTLAASELPLRRSIEIGTELRKRLLLAILREIEA